MMLNTKKLIHFEQSDSGFVGFFLQHQQNLELFDAKFNRRLHYELNPKLFAINEPYLMKAERDSLIKTKQDPEIVLDSDDSSKKITCTTNASKKRKKNIEKKCALLDANFSFMEEKTITMRLVEKYLHKNSMDSGNNNRKMNKKTLLKSIRLNDADSNPEAQSFVNSLFCNRFESLNYRTKLLCNPYYKTMKVKFGLSNFLIPPRCSFAGIDVVEGVKMLNRYLKLASIECKDKSSSNQSLICCKNPFVLIMDPAWDNNKSVKRKRSYETVSLDYMRKLCQESKHLLDSIAKLRKMRLTRYSHYKLSPMICAIWTTNLDKDFVIDEMLPLMNMKLSHVLKWHKVTKFGLPVKVHGGMEFLILAQQYSNDHPNGGDQENRTTNKDKKDDHQKGVVVSVPSAIHSHKPSVMPLIRRLFHFDDEGLPPDKYSTTLHCSTSDPNDRTASSTDKNDNAKDHDHDDSSNELVANEFINSLCGIELFARYLQTGFHSIGYECIKLQNEKLFNVVAE